MATITQEARRSIYAEAERLENLLDRNQIKSTADWRNLQNARTAVMELESEDQARVELHVYEDQEDELERIYELHMHEDDRYVSEADPSGYNTLGTYEPDDDPTPTPPAAGLVVPSGDPAVLAWSADLLRLAYDGWRCLEMSHRHRAENLARLRRYDDADLAREQAAMAGQTAEQIADRAYRTEVRDLQVSAAYDDANRRLATAVMLDRGHPLQGQAPATVRHLRRQQGRYANRAA